MRPLHLSIFIAATPQAIFDAWTSPQIMKKWLFKSKTNEIVSIESKVTVGGKYFILELNNGEYIDHFGIYTVIKAPTELSFTLEVPKHFPEETTIVLSINPRDSGAFLYFLQSGIDPDKTKPFWEEMLSNLKILLEE